MSRGRTARLVEIAGPTVGVITNVQPAHLEGLRNLDEILREKGRLWQSLRPEDLAVVNLDDERLADFSKRGHSPQRHILVEAYGGRCQACR